MNQQDVFEKTKQNLAQVINDAIQKQQLPTFLAAIALKELYTEAQTRANLEYQQYLQEQQSNKEQN